MSTQSTLIAFCLLQWRLLFLVDQADIRTIWKLDFPIEGIQSLDLDFSVGFRVLLPIYNPDLKIWTQCFSIERSLRNVTKQTCDLCHIPSSPCARQLEKTADISRRHHWFAREMTSEKWAQKLHTDGASLPGSGSCFWLAEANFPCGTTNQKHYPELDSDASSVWNFCARFSDVIWRGNQWWRREMWAFVFSH